MKILTLVFSLLLLVSCNSNPYASGKTLVSINGKKITDGDLDFLATINPNIARQLSTPFGKKQIVDNLVDQELLYQSSKKEGIDHDPEVKAKIDLYKKVILAQAYVEEAAAKEARKYYDSNPNEFEKLKLSHILIRFGTPKEINEARRQKRKNPNIIIPHPEKEALDLANKVYDLLKNGGNFAKLAKEYSEDIRTKENGGDLGPVSKNEPLLSRVGFQPLLEKAFEMKVGETGGPIKTTIGYHLIIVTAPLEVIPFEEAKNRLVLKTKRDVRTKILAQLKEKHKVQYAPELMIQQQPAIEPSTIDKASDLLPHEHEGGEPHVQPNPEQKPQE